jgi:hypothetical protein
MHKSPLDPRDISPRFWAVVKQADRDRGKMRELLERMTHEEMIAFHRQFFDAAMAVATPAHVAWMAQGTSEDGQGRAFFLDVLDHPENTPVDVEDHSNAQIFYEISPVFTSRFDENIYDYDDS